MSNQSDFRNIPLAQGAQNLLVFLYDIRKDY